VRNDGRSARGYSSVSDHHPISSKPSSVSRCFPVITLDVTGTVLSYKGSVGKWYCNAARRVGIPSANYATIESGFKEAYKETTERFPCFGYAHEMTSKDWWRVCVRRSFELAGHPVSDREFDPLFQRIYSLFGSPQIYEASEDITPFLTWCHRKGIVTGIISNCDERYIDGVLPMLNITDDLDFLVYSKKEGYEKPHPMIFEAALNKARQLHGLENLQPHQILHVGDNLKKDYHGAKEQGFEAVLMDRYSDLDLEIMKGKGIPVVRDFLDVVEYVTLRSRDFRS